MTPARHNEVLDPPKCRSLLATHTLGRLATYVDEMPMVYPLNYVLHGDTVAFRTVVGTKLDEIRDGRVVAFEVDDVDESTGEGWSVVVRGVAAEVTDPVATDALCADGLESWGHGDAADRFVRLPLTILSGRRTHRDT